jgi:hypothetical protein
MTTDRIRSKVYIMKADFSSANGVNMSVGSVMGIDPNIIDLPEGWVVCDGRNINDLTYYPALQNYLRRGGEKRLPTQEEISETINNWKLTIQDRNILN